MKEIFDVIVNIVMNPIFIQAIGFVALIVQVLSMQCKTYSKVIGMTIAAELIFGLQYIMLGGFTGAATNFAACLANLVYFLMIRKGKSTLPFQIIFGALFVTIGILTWEGPLSILVIIAKLVSTVSYGMKNTAFIRRCRLISMPLWLIYDIITLSIGGALNDILVIVSTIIGMVRLDRKKGSDAAAEENVVKEQP